VVGRWLVGHGALHLRATGLSITSTETL
jgi:hypothetical protein